jgi:hypothetical protein
MSGGLKKKELRTEDDLTLKQKKFVEILVSKWGEITKAEALKQAGYECKEEKYYSDIASKLTSRKHSPHVVKYLDKKLEKAAAVYERDRLRRYRRLEKYADNAFADKQYAAAINAEFRSGQLAGLYIDKREVTVSGLEGMSRAELEKKLQELTNKIDGFNETLLERRLKLYRPLSAITDPRSLVPDFLFSFPVHWQAFRKACWDLLQRSHASDALARFDTEAWAQDNGKKNSLDELELSSSSETSVV